MNVLSWLRCSYATVVRGLKLVLVLAFVALTLDVLWGVLSRYVLGAQSRWTEELAVYLLVWVSLLGASVTYEEKGHLGVDYFVAQMDAAAQRVAEIAVELLVAFFAAFALVYGGYRLVQETLASGQVSPALGWPMGYVYLAVPVSGVFFVLFCIRHLVSLLGSSGSALPERGSSQVEP